jgi:hypothetical protein
MKLSDQLKAKLIRLGWAVTLVERLRPGHWQRSSGAWTWHASGNYPGGGVFDIGSSETMRTCAKMTDEELKRELSLSR